MDLVVNLEWNDVQRSLSLRKTVSLPGCDTVEFPGLLWGSWLLTLMKHIPPKEFNFSEVLFHTTHLLMIIFQIFWTLIPCAVQIKWYFQIFYCYFFSLWKKIVSVKKVRQAQIKKTPNIVWRILKSKCDVEIGVQFQPGWEIPVTLGNVASTQMAGLPGHLFSVISISWEVVFYPDPS